LTMDTYLRRLPLSGINNARDLGGYPTKDGKATKFGRFFRTELPEELTDGDMAALKRLGVKTSIDLRGDLEVENIPSFFETADGIDYFRMPVFNKDVVSRAKRAEAQLQDVDWFEVYKRMLENNREWICGCLELMAGRDGAIMYNCTTGKDRTGMITAMLLGNAGVFDLDIIADYSVSQIYLADMYEKIRAYEGKYSIKMKKSSSFFKTSPEYMENLLLYINENHGGVQQYLSGCGLDERTLATLRDKLTA
jgi:protein-tyrosine phosphatase